MGFRAKSKGWEHWISENQNGCYICDKEKPVNLKTIGSRGSKLALWQAKFIQSKLEGLGVPTEIKVIKTKGDRIQHLSFDKMEGKGFFTKEIEAALLQGEIDIAVHSMKDLETAGVKGLVIAAVSERADPADLLIINKSSWDSRKRMHICENPKIGTSSARRKAQVLHYRPDAKLVDIRGNLPTRIAKIKSEPLDAIIVASAGVDRLKVNLAEYKVFKFDPREFVPAPAQGVLALQVRESDTHTRKILMQLHNEKVGDRTNIERAVLKGLGGGCQTPLGVYCEIDDDLNYHVWASMARSWNQKPIYVQHSSGSSTGLADLILDKLQKGPE